jgi:hypothetical protein
VYEGAILCRRPATKKSLYDKAYVFLFTDLMVISKEIAPGKEYFFWEQIAFDSVGSVEDVNGIHFYYLFTT